MQFAGIVICSAQIVTVQSFGELASVNASVGEKTVHTADFNLLIIVLALQKLILLVVVEFGVCDLMDCRRDGLNLAHTFADVNILALGVVKAVHVCRHRLNRDRNRSGTFQCFHENVKVLYIAVEIGRKLRKRFALGLADIEDRHGLEHGDADFFFLGDGFAVRVQHRELGVRIELFFLDFLLEGSRCDNFDAALTLHDVPSELVVPLIEARHMSGIRHLHIDQHLIVDAVMMETAHSREILFVFVALKKLLDAFFDGIGDLFEPFFVCLFGFSQGLSVFLYRHEKTSFFRFCGSAF